LRLSAAHNVVFYKPLENLKNPEESKTWFFGMIEPLPDPTDGAPCHDAEHAQQLAVPAR
jgi:hypothetical protein